jgi:hypothetical protein
MRRVSGPLLAVAAALLSAATFRAQEFSSEVTESSRPVRLLRNWYDTIKTPKGEIARRVDIIYDYSKAAAYERWYTTDGRMFFQRKFVLNPPTASDKEIEEAFEIVRNDPQLSPVIRWFHGVLDGGFVIEEGRGKACGPGARCLLIQILSPDRSGLIRVVAVDLVKRNIPYRAFVPSEHPGVK